MVTTNAAGSEHIIAPPAKELSIEEAYKYIDNGINTIKELHGDADALIGWLDYCCQAFKTCPYGNKIMLDCLDLKVSIMKQRRAFEEAQAEVGSDQPVPSLEPDAFDAVLNEIAKLLCSGMIREARLTLESVRRSAEHFEKKLFDEDSNDGLLSLNFDDPVEYLAAVSESSQKNDGLPIEWSSPGLARFYYLDGLVFYEEGLYSHSITCHKKSLQYNPVSCKTWLEMGECYKKLDMPNELLECAWQARAYAWRVSDVARCHRALSYAYSEMHQYEQACEHLLVAQDYFPTPQGEQELSWLVSQGFNVDLVNRDVAFEHAGVEAADGCPATPPFAAAVLNVASKYVENVPEEVDPFGEEVLLNLLLWEPNRREYYNLHGELPNEQMF